MIKLELTVDEINTVLRGLSKLTFEEVVVLVGKIKSSGDAQIAALKETEDKKKPAKPAAK